MFAKNQDSSVTLDSQVECLGNHDFAAGTFQIRFSTSFDVHELDQIESGIKQAGQEFKRQLTRHVLVAADRPVRTKRRHIVDRRFDAQNAARLVIRLHRIALRNMFDPNSLIPVTVIARHFAFGKA